MPESFPFEDLCRAGRQHLKAGRAREALDSFEAARRLNNLSPEVYDGLATAHSQLGDYEPAAENYEAATRLDPRRGTCWINLGAIYNRLGKHQKAAEVLRRAVQVERKNSVGFYNLGFAYKHLKQWNMAIPAYREAIRLDPKMADAYLNLGNVYLAMQNLPQATTHFKKALDLDPKLERAQKGLEQAEALSREAAAQRSPFGRLVDTAAEHGGSSPEGCSRELTEEERIRDRRAVGEILSQVQLDLDEMLASLKAQVEPGVKTLNRLLTHRASLHGESLTKADAYENFVEARKAFLPRLTQFRRALQRLREHEASVK